MQLDRVVVLFGDGESPEEECRVVRFFLSLCCVVSAMLCCVRCVVLSSCPACPDYGQVDRLCLIGDSLT